MVVVAGFAVEAVAKGFAIAAEVIGVNENAEDVVDVEVVDVVGVLENCEMRPRVEAEQIGCTN